MVFTALGLIEVADVAVICSAIPARRHLLARAAETWQRSIISSGLDAAICIWSEGLRPWEQPRFLPQDDNIFINGQNDISGSHIKGYNYWRKAVQADVYIFTHPDLLFPVSTVKAAYDAAQDDVYVAFKCFWIPQGMTEDLDNYRWRSPEKLENAVALYADDDRAHGEFYANDTVRQITTWESSTTYAINNFTANRLYPLPDFGHQGADDPYQAGARLRLGIRNHTILDPILMHQWHSNTWHGTSEEALIEATAALRDKLGLLPQEGGKTALHKRPD